MRDRRKNKAIPVALIAAALLLMLVGLTAGARRTSMAEDLFYNALTPVQGFVARLTDSVTDWFERVFLPNEIQQENAELRAQLALLERKTFLYDELARENARLTELLDYAGGIAETQFIAAAVTSRGTDLFFDTLTVSAGARQGVVKDAAVICPDGIVGRVYEVGLDYCKIRTVRSENLVVPVLVARTRDSGMLGGEILQNGIRIGTGFVRIESESGEFSPLRVGDLLITSGEDGAFPRGLPAGEIILLSPQGQAKAYDACAVSAVDFARLEVVLIVVTLP
ncbi:MAG: rod shape-determining protein MreC [Clostridiales bacterium]|nr:rod shape-determining protein MreC [Clostridiales bacterium]